VFDFQLDTDSSFTSYNNKIFFTWDGNHRFFAWKKIDHVHTEDEPHEPHVFVDSIILARQPNDILSLLIAMHNIIN
jgi:hypothetical protein